MAASWKVALSVSLLLLFALSLHAQDATPSGEELPGVPEQEPVHDDEAAHRERLQQEEAERLRARLAQEEAQRAKEEHEKKLQELRVEEERLRKEKEEHARQIKSEEERLRREREKYELEQEELNALREKLAAAEERANHAEQQLNQIRHVEKEKEAELAEKENQLKAALEEERKAKEVIERESKNYQSLSEAKHQLEQKISLLENKLTKAEGDSEMLAKMKEELKKMQDALKNEKEAKKLVIRLKKEKDELRQQLEETRESFLFQVQETIVTLGHASTEKAKEVAAQAAELAAMLKSNIGQVDQEVSQQFSKFVSSPHAKRARAATAPVLSSAHSSLSALLANFLSIIRFPVPQLRNVVKSSVGSMGLFSQYQDEAAGATDYWMLIGPCVGANIILIFSWMNQSARHFGFRVQLILFLFWAFLSAISFFYDSMPTALLANNFSAAQIVLLYAVIILHYALAVTSYFYVIIRGPSRILAAMQWLLASWVLISFMNLLFHPLLRRGKESCSTDDFTKAHLMRAFTGMLFASFGARTPSFGAT